MIKFRFDKFLMDKRKSLSDLAKELKIQLGSLSIMNKRGTVKPSFLNKLETEFGDCTTYIKK